MYAKQLWLAAKSFAAATSCRAYMKSRRLAFSPSRTGIPIELRQAGESYVQGTQPTLTSSGDVVDHAVVMNLLFLISMVAVCGAASVK